MSDFPDEISKDHPCDNPDYHKPKNAKFVITKRYQVNGKLSGYPTLAFIGSLQKKSVLFRYCFHAQFTFPDPRGEQKDIGEKYIQSLSEQFLGKPKYVDDVIRDEIRPLDNNGIRIGRGSPSHGSGNVFNQADKNQEYDRNKDHFEDFLSGKHDVYD